MFLKLPAPGPLTTFVLLLQLFGCEPLLGLNTRVHSVLVNSPQCVVLELSMDVIDGILTSYPTFLEMLERSVVIEQQTLAGCVGPANV